MYFIHSTLLKCVPKIKDKKKALITLSVSVVFVSRKVNFYHVVSALSNLFVFDPSLPYPAPFYPNLPNLSHKGVDPFDLVRVGGGLEGLEVSGNKVPFLIAVEPGTLSFCFLESFTQWVELYECFLHIQEPWFWAPGSWIWVILISSPRVSERIVDVSEIRSAGLSRNCGNTTHALHF